MTYAKFGPFTNGSASPPISAAFVTAVDAALAAANVYWAPNPSGVDDTAAVNTFIASVPDYAQVLFSAGTYQFTNTVYDGAGMNITHPVRLTGLGATLKVLSGSNSIGVVAVNSSNVIIENFRFSSIVGVGEGIFLNQAQATTPISNITITGCRFDNVFIGIYALQYVTDTFIHGNTFQQGGFYGVLLNDGVGLSRFTIANNTFRDGVGGDAIELNGSTNVRTDMQILGNRIYNWRGSASSSSVGHGIAVAFTNGCVIANNYIRGADRNGIHLEAGSSNVTVIGNETYDCQNAGIELQGDSAQCTRVVIANNIVGNCAIATNTFGGHLSNGGIDIGASNSSVNTGGGAYFVTVRGNQVHGCRSAGIWLQYAAYSEVSGNTVTNTYGTCNDTAVGSATGRNAGIYVIGATGVQFSRNTVVDSRGVGIDGGSATQYYPLAFSGTQTTSLFQTNTRAGNLSSTDLNPPSGTS